MRATLQRLVIELLISMTYYMAHAFPDSGRLLKESDYLYQTSRIFHKNKAVAEFRDIVKKGT